MLVRRSMEQIDALIKLSWLRLLQCVPNVLGHQGVREKRVELEPITNPRCLSPALKAALMIGMLSQQAHAEAFFIDNQDSLGLVRGVELTVNDEVSDGCWTNVSLARQKIRLILEQSKIPVHEDNLINNPFFPMLVFQLSDSGPAEFALVVLNLRSCMKSISLGRNQVDLMHISWEDSWTYGGKKSFLADLENLTNKLSSLLKRRPRNSLQM
jgi:hypothetical protein